MRGRTWPYILFEKFCKEHKSCNPFIEIIFLGIDPPSFALVLHHFARVKSLVDENASFNTIQEVRDSLVRKSMTNYFKKKAKKNRNYDLLSLNMFAEPYAFAPCSDIVTTKEDIATAGDFVVESTSASITSGCAMYQSSISVDL